MGSFKGLRFCCRIVQFARVKENYYDYGNLIRSGLEITSDTKTQVA